MSPQSVIVRFDAVAEQVSGPVMRIVGFTKARDLIQLLDSADLEANPRVAKSGAVTDDIIDSIEEDTAIFPFKTKGILIGSSDYEKLQRNRYRLGFENTKIEGILDGGHNTLAIGTHILTRATGDARIASKIKKWADFRDHWAENRDAVDELKARKPGDKDYAEDSLDFLVPVEVLVPADVENPDTVDAFNSCLLAICSARNNNVQLTLETKAAKKGFYEVLREALPLAIEDRVEWKSNEGGPVKARDLIALAWIPLSKLAMDFIPVEFRPKVAPQNIYRNKGECAKLFDELMSRDEVSEATDGEYTRKVHNKAIKSALKLAGSIPAIFDKVYRDFPAAYNANGGKFGNISVVKMADNMRSQPTSYFTDSPVEYSYPDGLIMPLVYGLKALMRVNANGCVEWAQDPTTFLDKHLPHIVRKYRVVLDAFRFDPQKVGKNEGSYDLVVDAYETQVMLSTKQ